MTRCAYTLISRIVISMTLKLLDSSESSSDSNICKLVAALKVCKHLELELLNHASAQGLAFSYSAWTCLEFPDGSTFPSGVLANSVLLFSWLLLGISPGTLQRDKPGLSSLVAKSSMPKIWGIAACTTISVPRRELKCNWCGQIQSMHGFPLLLSQLRHIDYTMWRSLPLRKTCYYLLCCRSHTLTRN